VNRLEGVCKVVWHDGGVVGRYSSACNGNGSGLDYISGPPGCL